MPHYKELHAKPDDKYLAAWELHGKDSTLEIESVAKEEVIGEGGRKEMLPVVRFKDRKKGFILNKTNSDMIAELHGTDTDGWPKKKVILYPTTTDFQGKTKECIRILTKA